MGPTLLVIGANTAFEDVDEFTQLAKAGYRAFFVEPIPGIQAGLRQNLRRMGFNDSTATILNNAVGPHSSSNAMLPFCVSNCNQNSTCSHLVGPDEHCDVVIDVESLSVASLLDRSGIGPAGPDILDIDTEGM